MWNLLSVFCYSGIIPRHILTFYIMYTILKCNFLVIDKGKNKRESGCRCLILILVIYMVIFWKAFFCVFVHSLTAIKLKRSFLWYNQTFFCHNMSLLSFKGNKCQSTVYFTIECTFPIGLKNMSLSFLFIFNQTALTLLLTTHLN